MPILLFCLCLSEIGPFSVLARFLNVYCICQYITDDYDRALREFSEASKLGEGNLQALTGTVRVCSCYLACLHDSVRCDHASGRIKCKIMVANFKEAEQGQSVTAIGVQLTV